MATRARRFGLDETFIAPKVLPPPPTRHALLTFLIALAAILHLGTVGWSDIHNGVEGLYASDAREMLRGETWIPPDKTAPPLMLWLLVVSYKIFGVTAVAAHVPIAIAFVGSVALTFLIGERLAGYWRGFAAGLIHLCCLGPFVWGRIVTPAPLLGLLIGAALFCAVRGYEQARYRQRWFAGFWICTAFAYLTVGLWGVVYPGAILLILAFLFREARLRFQQLFRWPALFFLALVLPWHVWMSSNGSSPGEQFLFGTIPGNLSGAAGLGLPRFLGGQLLWLSPAVLLILPGTIFALRKIVRPHEFDLAAALPIVWLGIGLLPLLFVATRQDYQSITIWSPFALWAACAWERTPNRFRLAGIALVSLLGLAIVISAWANAFGFLPALPVSKWIGFRTIAAIAGGGVTLACGFAVYFISRNREELALAIVLLAMVAVGLTAAEGCARFGPYLSLADSARFLQPRLGATGEALFEGTEHEGSSLRFYLERPPVLVRARGHAPQSVSRSPREVLDVEAATERMSAARPVFLIVHKDRVPFWQERLTERFHIYHHAASCGQYVVLNSQP